MVFLSLIFISVIPILNNKLRVNEIYLWGFLSILVGLNISFYTIVDKQAVSSVHPFVYPILITIGGSMGVFYW